LRARRPRLGRCRGWRGRRWGGRRLERRPKVRLEGRGRAQTEEEAQEPQEERGAEDLDGLRVRKFRRGPPLRR